MHVMQVVQAHAEHAPAAVDGFLPHGFCYLWNKPLLLTHLWSDVLIGASYVVISFALAALVHRARKDIPFSVVSVAFGLFIITCGMTHFMEVWTLWQPVYWLSGGVKVVTAVASVSAAVAMPFMVPKVHTTIRDAKRSREQEVAAARAEGLAAQNARLEALAADLARANADLRRTAAEADEARRTAEEARQVADAANRVKSEFLAVMSHELRTPLNAIGGYTELIELGLRGPVTPQQTEDLRRIRRSQAHLLGLITDVLNFSRLEGAGVTYAPRAVPLAAVLDDASARRTSPCSTAAGRPAVSPPRPTSRTTPPETSTSAPAASASAASPRSRPRTSSSAARPRPAAAPAPCAPGARAPRVGS